MHDLQKWNKVASADFIGSIVLKDNYKIHTPNLQDHVQTFYQLKLRKSTIF